MGHFAPVALLGRTRHHGPRLSGPRVGAKSNHAPLPQLQQDLPEDPELGVMLEKVTADALTKKVRRSLFAVPQQGPSRRLRSRARCPAAFPQPPLLRPRASPFSFSLSHDVITHQEWYTGPEDAARWITILTDGRAGSRGVEYALKVFNVRLLSRVSPLDRLVCQCCSRCRSLSHVRAARLVSLVFAQHLEERRLPMQQEALQRLRDALETRTPALAAEAVPRVATALLTAKPSRSAARKAREEAEGRGEGGADGLASQ